MAKYFESFPIINYQIGQKNKRSVDIIRRYNVPSYVYDADTYSNFFQQDGDTPEGIAYRDYGDISKYWSFLLFNKVIDPFNEWAQPDRFVEEKLKSDYPGISLFVTLNEIDNLDTSTIDTKGSNASYRVNDIVKIYDDNDALIDTGTLYEYDRSTGHMKVNDVETFDLSAGYYITDVNLNKKMYIARKFDYANLGLYEFTNSSGFPVNPYSLLGGERLINLYIRGNDNDILSTYDINVVTIRDHALNVNESLRILYYPTFLTLSQIEKSAIKFNKNTQ